MTFFQPYFLYFWHFPNQATPYHHNCDLPDPYPPKPVTHVPKSSQALPPCGFPPLLASKILVQNHQKSAKTLVTMTERKALNLYTLLCYTEYTAKPCFSDTCAGVKAQSGFESKAESRREFHGMKRNKENVTCN